MPKYTVRCIELVLRTAQSWRLKRLRANATESLEGYCGSLTAAAQQAEHVRRIGYVTAAAHTFGMFSVEQEFLDGLHDHGYVEGHNVAIEVRSTGDGQNGSRTLRPNWFDCQSTCSLSLYVGHRSTPPAA